LSELWKRILSSIVFVALILGPLFIDALVAFVVYGLLGFLTYLEFGRLVKKGEHGIKPGWVTGAWIYTLVAVALLGIVVGLKTNVHWIVTLAMGGLMLGMAREVFRTPFQPLNIAAELFGAIYCAAGFWGMTYFFAIRQDLNTLWLPISAFLLIWVNDSAAYLFGRKIGKTPLIPKVSPKKTIEGSVAGLLTALLAGAGLSFIPNMPPLPVMLGMALVSVVFGSIGDLFESILKRSVGVKDSGTFLPGHGGFLDRFDAMLMAVPALIVYFEFVLPKH